MRLKIYGDISTNGRGQSAVNAKTAIEDSVCKKNKVHDIAIVNLEAPVFTEGARVIDKHGLCLKITYEAISYIIEHQ